MAMLWMVLEFGLGFLTASCWQQHRWKKAEKEWAQKQRQKNMELELSRAKDRVSAAEQAALTMNQKNLQMKSQQAKEQTKVETHQQSQPRSRSVKAVGKPDIREAFQTVETLSLRFQYQLPDSLILQPGKGYLRNNRDELIPGPDIMSGVNTAAGYAMDGLFYLYNVVYHGKEYSFQQIMNGEMGSSYIRVQSVLEPARIVKVGSAGYYALAAPGRLRAEDMG